MPVFEIKPVFIDGTDAAAEWVDNEHSAWNEPLLRTTAPLADRWTVPTLEAGQPADLVLLDLDTVRKVEPSSFKSKAKFSPWAGQELRGWPTLTLVGGKVAYRRE